MEIIRTDKPETIKEIVSEIDPYITLSNIEKMLLKGQIFYIAQINGENIGCVSINTISKIRAKIEKLYIKPAFRHLGYGRELVEKCIDSSIKKGYKKVTLGMNSNNIMLLNWYNSLGFCVKKAKKIKRTGMTVFFMERLLDLKDLKV